MQTRKTWWGRGSLGSVTKLEKVEKWIERYTMINDLERIRACRGSGRLQKPSNPPPNRERSVEKLNFLLNIMPNG